MSKKGKLLNNVQEEHIMLNNFVDAVNDRIKYRGCEIFTDRMSQQNNKDTANIVLMDAKKISDTLHRGNIDDNMIFLDGFSQGMDIGFDMARNFQGEKK